MGCTVGDLFFIHFVPCAATAGVDTASNMGTPTRTHGRSASDPKRDLDLARRVVDGDRGAAQRFATRLMPTVRTVAIRLTRSSADAQDAAQEALVELLRSACNYRGDGPLEGWARTVALRSVARWMRRHASPPSPPGVGDEVAAAPVSTFVLDHLPRPLDAYLSELAEPQRTALLLRCSLGCTIPEIAKLTDSPTPTVKSRVSRALAIIRSTIRRDMRFGTRKQAEG